MTLLWKITFSKAGVPDLTLSGRELATYAGGAIQRLEDIFDAGTPEAMAEWMSAHGGSLS